MIGDILTSSGALASKVPVKPSLFIYATTLSGIANFMIGLVPLTFIAIFFDDGISLKFLFIVPWLCLVFLCICSIGTLTAILFSNFDDSRNIIAIFLMLLTYVTPIFYPLEMLHGLAYKIVQLNPFTTGINIFREVVLGYGDTDSSNIVFAFIVISALFIISRKLLKKFWPEMVTRV
jgi:ABC-type polysaccharide/polyol phosphate export permease